MSQNTLFYILGASVLLGTLGGMLERASKPGSGTYRVGVVLASLGTDLASLGKLTGGGQ